MAAADSTSESNREKQVFDLALELEAGPEREAFVSRACGGDEALLRRVTALLLASEAPAGFLSDAPREGLSGGGEVAAMGPGNLIGRYRLVEVIGEGGFGIVYLAEEREPLSRKVALKLLKPGMDSRQVISRFESERQVLSLMDHPNIARVYDAGETAAGRPYFVMELVRGMPITQFAEAGALGLESRIELFIQVCFAVQHAHQKGVIHRDLKPTNVLVALHGDRPVPKVIDFGIAKATQQPLSEKAMLTAYLQFVGTPAYMSPEQASLGSMDIDTRSDIYGLGVLLYELLTGSPPFDTKELLSSGVDAMRRTIQEAEPERPSTRLRRRSRTGETRIGSTAASRLPPDLDRIVLKALEKDRDRRYATANGLAADLRRFLNQEPVSAVAPTLSYQIGKFVRRHRRVAMTALAFIGLLAVAIVVSLGFGLRARRAEVLAQNRADAAQQVSEFYWKSLLKQLTPWQHTNPMVTLREALDHSAGEIRERLAANPLSEAAVRLAVGRTYTGLSEYALADTHLVRAEELVRSHEKPPGELAAEVFNQLAILRSFQGDHLASEQLWDEVARIRSERYPPNHREVVNPAARAMLRRVARLEPAEAVPLLREWIPRSREVLGPTHYLTHQTMNQLGLALANLGQFDEACGLFETTRRQATEEEGAASNGALASLELLAVTRARQGRFPEATTLFGELLDMRNRVNLPDHQFTLVTRLHRIEHLLRPQKCYAEAGAELMEIADVVWDRWPTLRTAVVQHIQFLLREWRDAGLGAGFEDFESRVRAKGYLGL